MNSDNHKSLRWIQLTRQLLMQVEQLTMKKAFEQMFFLNPFCLSYLVVLFQMKNERNFNILIVFRLLSTFPISAPSHNSKTVKQIIPQDKDTH